MEYAKMKSAIAIINECDCLSITEDDKRAVIHVFGTIMQSIRELGLVTTDMSARYAILKISTWSNGYFCESAKQMCELLYPVVERCEKLFYN